MVHRRTLASLLALTALLAACGGGDAGTDTTADTDTVADSAATPATVQAPEGTVTPPPIAAADIDVYERGLRAELELVEEAARRLREARNGQDSASAILATTELNTIPAAAERIGVDVERYRVLRDAFGSALAARATTPAMSQMAQTIDTSDMASLSPEQQARVRENLAQMRAAFSDTAWMRTIPLDTRDEFRRRAEGGLDSLWSELFTARARAAGLAR